MERLLYYSPGTISLASHILLRETGLPFSAARVRVAQNKHRNYRTPEFLAVNPRGLVPVLVVGQETITESVAIALYLAETTEGQSLLPPMGTFDRVRALEWLAWLATAVHRVIGGYYRPEHVVEEPIAASEVQAFAKAQFQRYCEEIEAKIVEGSHYILGDRYSLVDPFLLVYYRWGAQMGLDMRSLRRWSSLAERMLERPAVTEALQAEGIAIWPEPPA
ncbi:glutathione S-transferase N-terminal domain-containing protein [Phyllobacterium leguminum]|uniref:Glutathione S-transferase n=1 Tax=Phyllobacterium leguminum TaxID=314237 RepID=A0A318SZZ4_9HYPH|nr:glutathione S-transferase N-terminal domain-containing protein [Phyllobacterium leguminum]PYE87545.1 glutathione S-transferase [Phyllobacterium leguminum]